MAVAATGEIHVPTLFDEDRIYVPDMTHHSQLDGSLVGRVVFDGPVADDTVLIATATVVAATEYTLSEPVQADPNFGRTIVVTSTDAGDITVHGRDYLNQPVSETLTCIVGDIDSLKAFKWIDGYTTAADLAGDITFKTGTNLGLPFVVSDILQEYADGVVASAPAHVAPATATPTATTGDVRGTVNPTTALNGSKDIELVVRFDNGQSGGLHGQVQYYA